MRTSAIVHSRLLLVVLALAAGAAAQQQQDQGQARTNSRQPVKIDPAFAKAASETGGQVYVFDRSKAADAVKVMALTASGERDALLSVNDRLNGERTYSANVEPDIARLVVSVTGTKDFELRRPSGPAVGKTENVVEYAETANGAIYSVQYPEAGEWSVTLRGKGDVALRMNAVRGKQSETLLFSRFEFVEKGGRPGHEGMFAIQGYPLAGRESPVEAELDGEVASVRFEFRSPNGETLRTFRLAKIPGSDFGEYAGKVAVPDVPFFVYAVGVDMRGKRFQRMRSGQVNPQTFRVSAPYECELRVGEPSACTVAVTNYGSPGSFGVTVGDPRHLLSAFAPASFQLETNASTQLKLTFKSEVAAEVLGGKLVITVRRLSDAQTNFAIIDANVLQRTTP